MARNYVRISVQMSPKFKLCSTPLAVPWAKPLPQASAKRAPHRAARSAPITYVLELHHRAEAIAHAMSLQAVAVVPKKNKTSAAASSIPSVMTFTQPKYPPHPDDDLVKAGKLVKVRSCLARLSHRLEPLRCSETRVRCCAAKCRPSGEDAEHDDHSGLPRLSNCRRHRRGGRRQAQEAGLQELGGLLLPHAGPFRPMIPSPVFSSLLFSLLFDKAKSCVTSGGLLMNTPFVTCFPAARRH